MLPNEEAEWEMRQFLRWAQFKLFREEMMERGHTTYTIRQFNAWLEQTSPERNTTSATAR